MFISYSSKDQSYAEATRQLLIREKIDNWMAPYDIPAGYKYAHVINDAIENCACVLLLLSKDSQISEFVEREIERAISYKKPIVSMHIDDSTLNSGFKYYLGSAQIVPIKSIDKGNYEVQKVIRGLQSFVNSDICEKSTDLKNANQRLSFQKFISSIKVSDYAKAEKSLKSKENLTIDFHGGVFYICHKVLDNPQTGPDGRQEFEEILLVSQILYTLANEYCYYDFCALMSTISTPKYIEASSNIKEYMMEELNALDGEFINMIFQALSSKNSNRSYWEHLLKEIFVWLHICSK